MKRRRNTIARIAAALLLLQAGTAGAALIEADLFAAGDGLLTVDTATGLEWLDLTQTLNMSFAQVAAGNGGWLGMGFMQADATQVQALWTGNGVAIGVQVPGNYGPTANLISLLGLTGGNTTIPQGRGLMANAAAPLGVSTSLLWANATGGWGGGALQNSHAAFLGTTTGNYLYRQVSSSTVPEPATLGLLAVGLLALGATRGRRRARN